MKLIPKVNKSVAASVVAGIIAWGLIKYAIDRLPGGNVITDNLKTAKDIVG